MLKVLSILDIPLNVSRSGLQADAAKENFKHCSAGNSLTENRED
jgi:hypothetical protein